MNFGILFLILIYAVEASFDDCYYSYKHECYKEKSVNNSSLVCSPDNISIVNMELTDNGLLRASLGLVNLNCLYKVALLVDTSIKNKQECKNLIFNDDNNYEDKIHTNDRKICVEKSSDIDDNCQMKNLIIEYQYIFTGCYSLRFTIDGKNYITSVNEFFNTNYTMTNIKEPQIRCSFDNRDNLKDSNYVTFNLEISMVSISPSMTLQLRSLSSDYETEIDACNQYSKKLQYDWEISLDKHNQDVNNCHFMMIQNNSVTNKIYAIDIECNFLLPVSFNNSYCFLLLLNDERCDINTIWNPPPINLPPCAWMSHCDRIIKPKSKIIYDGLLQDNIHTSTNSIILIPITVSIIILIIIICAVTYTINRCRLLNEQEYLNANLRELKIKNNIDCNIDTDDECRRICNTSLDNRTKSIVLLYARGTPSFMSFMTEFRDILNKHCDCHVYDWYAASEWNSVAKVGACDWAVNLIKKNHRAVWIDTPAARLLMNECFTSQIQLNNDAISDFRDMAFPAVLECAKRNFIDSKFQYNQHFIVRLEGVKGHSSEDPFSDLSPHTRYLIPYHLKQICSYLSSGKTNNCGNALMTAEVQLRERLIQIKNDI
ncbi:hypothetical protein HCN44_001000 [Aphidius gifuensis]|uniref:SEFIR domain-containing protein n=1 Tax=Aphidius gifuensis TaxID=684658 RepID=A0A835CLN5_APHGI|nr:uncharacterized protein LOC122856782 [Aphidius gifuensis]KAF7988427.1 hypothetical protein HCN44_001000 [Aphidius gifuensis]